MDDAHGALGLTFGQTRAGSSSQATLTPAETSSRTEAFPVRGTSGCTCTLFVQRRNGCGVESMLFSSRQFVLDQFFNSFQHQNLAGIAEGKCKCPPFTKHLSCVHRDVRRLISRSSAQNSAEE